MTKFTDNFAEDDQLQNDHRLIQAYQEATNLDEEGLEALCPSYIELSESSTRYEDDHLLGKGGVKEVYRTFDHHTRRWVAMARLREDRGPEFYDLFVNEAWLTSSLNHPNIISVHDVGIDSSGHPFFTMDLKGNTTLASFIGSDDRDQRALLRDFLKICDAISYAHSHGIIHLDLKPENIQTDAFGEVLVCDWGLGKVVSELEQNSPASPAPGLLDNMTLVGEIKGSPGYMAPEQIERDAVKDHRTDIFSLGCILHAILTGEPPFQGDCQAMLDATSREKPTNPCQKFPELNVPPSLGAVTMKALARRPDERYQSISELKDDVQRHMEGFSTHAEKRNFLRETYLFVSRNRTPVAITTLAIVLLTVLSTLFVQKLDFLHQSVLEESQLAEHYANKAEDANDRYIETLSKSERNQRTLSRSLMSSVKNLKNKGIFDTPMKSIREAKVLADHALSLNPESKNAKYELFALNLIQLNFKEALQFPLPENHSRSGYMSFANTFPEFDYHRGKRPELDELCAFLAEARDLDPGHSPVIERMISYDAAVRPAGSSYHKVILELIKYLNPGNNEIDLTREKPLELRLTTKNAARFISDPGGSEESVLRYLNFRTLVVECQDTIDLHQFNGLPIQTLDLSNCRQFTLSKPVSLPFLETVIVPPGNHSTKELGKWIQDLRSIEIIEKSHLSQNQN